MVVIDSDGHLHEPFDLFDRYIEKEFYALRARVVDLRDEARVRSKSLMYASDYPHSDMNWKRVQAIRAYEGLREAEKDAILGGNAQRFYKL